MLANAVAEGSRTVAVALGEGGGGEAGRRGGGGGETFFCCCVQSAISLVESDWKFQQKNAAQNL